MLSAEVNVSGAENIIMDKKIDKRITRPFFCYDKKCRVIYSSYSEESFKKGFSFFCYGKLPKAHVFVEKEATHKNNICHCYYTPLKGAIRFFVCEEDLWGEANAMCHVLDRLKKVKGDCGHMQNRVIRYQCFKKGCNV